MRLLVTALQFLTIIRLRDIGETTGNDLGRSMAWFPLVGAFVGLIAAGVAVAAQACFSPYVAAVFVVAALIIITGALHQDGFGDTVDGLAAGRNRERALAIMKDSAIGSYGVVGLILLIAAKVTLIADIPRHMLVGTLIAMPVTGRWATVCLASVFPYARSGAGTAEVFVRFAGKREAASATVWALIVTVAATQWRGLLAFAVCVIWTICMGTFFQRRIGGVTGDVMGAANETAEVLFLIGMIVVARLTGGGL